MHNKESCRVCGSYLIPASSCNACTEYISWICGRCDKTVDVTHSHNYCRMAYRKEDGKRSSDMVIKVLLHVKD